MIDAEKITREEIELAVGDFGGLLKKFRIYKGWTFEEFSERIGSTPSYLFRLEKNQRVATLDFQFKVLSRLDWSDKDLIQFLFLILAKMNEDNQSSVGKNRLIRKN